ncbi:TerD family protein [Streptomyces sp. P38-E01]|uniref:TerD family protein n=1 Tax=Streptomyces tardus TaxID=2780544 RepID=A0A949JFD6_9ACTN|nr:TerD family protein [Streptomyces tardus]
MRRPAGSGVWRWSWAALPCTCSPADFGGDVRFQPSRALTPRVLRTSGTPPTAGASGGVLGKLRQKKGTDLDLIAIAMHNGDPVRMAGLDSLDPMGNGSLVHSGDNQSGHGDGDDETVTVEFAGIPAHISSIVFVAAAYKKGRSFQKARNISFKVYDATGGR